MMEGNEMNTQIDVWLSGIYEEIKFWNESILTGGEALDRKRWEENIRKGRPFILEEEIPPEKAGQEYQFVDVGSGPFSGCGFVTDKVILKHVAVDPLADAYKVMKAKAGIENEVNLKTGFVEILDHFFERNVFDMVHMSNSLDHSFNPVLGIYQLINICKIGGKVILRHKDNEAVFEKYEGFHQWNLKADIENNEFVIWRDAEFYNVNRIFGEYVDIQCVEDSVYSALKKVVMIKKRDIVIPDNDVYDTMLSKIYPFMIQVIMNDVIANVNSPKAVYIDSMLYKLHRAADGGIRRLLTDSGKWEKNPNVVIYGMGSLGKELLDILRKEEVSVSGLIDVRALEFDGMKTIHPDAYTQDSSVDAIVITAYNGANLIKQKLLEKGVEAQKLMTIEELLGEKA